MQASNADRPRSHQQVANTCMYIHLTFQMLHVCKVPHPPEAARLHSGRLRSGHSTTLTLTSANVAFNPSSKTGQKEPPDISIFGMACKSIYTYSIALHIRTVSH